jgi:hypothetical protein
MEQVNNRELNGKWQDLVDKCIDAYNDIDESEYRQRKIDNIKESRRIYEMIETSTSFPWKDAYNIVLPFLTITVDNLEPRIVASITGREPYLQFNLRGKAEPDELTAFIEEWFNAELKEVVKLENETSHVCHTILLEGTVYPVATYCEDKITRTEYEYSEDGMNVLVGEDGEAVTHDVEDSLFQGGKIEYVDFNDIYIPDNTDDWEKTDIIRIVRPTYGELKLWEKEQNGYMNIGKWLLADEVEQEDKSPSQDIVDVDFTGQKVIECLEYYVDYVYKKDTQDEEDVTDWTSERYVALIAKESEVLIRLLPLREINFQNEHIIKRIRLYPEKGRAYGSSMYEKMKSIQNGSSDTFNLLMNTAYICIIPWFLYSVKTGLPEDMELKPGAGIEVDDPSSVVFPKFNVNFNSFLPIFDVWTQLWERLGSIGDLQAGKPSHKAETATETMAVIQEGNIKHNYQSKVFKEEFLGLLRTLFDLYYKNMPFNKTFFYQGKEVIIPRKAMRRPLNFRLTGSTDLSNKILELRKLEQLYRMLSNNPVTNPVEITKDVVSGFRPDIDPEKYINPEIAQLLRQHFEQKKMQAEMAQKQREAGASVQAAQNILGQQR